jgi:hypothetical protein
MYCGCNSVQGLLYSPTGWESSIEKQENRFADLESFRDAGGSPVEMIGKQMFFLWGLSPYFKGLVGDGNCIEKRENRSADHAPHSLWCMQGKNSFFPY